MISKTLYLAAAVAAALIPQALATIYVTSPVAGTICNGGTTCNVQWDDDGNPPTLATIGPCEIGLYVGSVDQQTELQQISPSLDVSQNAFVAFTPNPTDGPNDDIYFIRFTSLGYKDPSTGGLYAYEQFSAKFTLNNMSGTFNATVQNQISGATAPAASAPAASTPAPSSTSHSSTTGLLTTTVKASSTSSKATTSASATSKSAAAPAVAAVGKLGGILGVVVAALALFA